MLSHLELLAGRNELRTPKVASSGAGFFLVWSERLFGDPDVLGTRLGETGAVLEAPGRLLSTAANPQEQPAVASNGTDYLVVWMDRRGESWDLYGTRVSATSEVLDPTGIALCTEVSRQSQPAVASDGTDYFVVWTDEGTRPYPLRGARVSREGRVLDADGVLLYAGAMGVWSPRVASNGTEYLVVWETSGGSPQGGDIRWVRVSREAKVLGGNVLLPANSIDQQAQPAVASNGQGYLVLWLEVAMNGKPPLWEVRGTRMSGDGGVLDASPILLSSSPIWRGPLAVTSNGVDYFVAWPSASDIVGARVSGEGQVLDPGGIPISTGPGFQSSPAVAHVGDGYLVVWESSSRERSTDVYGRWVSGDGRVAGPSDVPLATGPHDERTPAVAASATPRALVTYGDFVEHPDIRTRRVVGRSVALEQPLAFMQSARTREDEPLALVLGGAHPTGSPLSFQVVSAPAHGALAGSPSEPTYTPRTNFHGEDSFTFTVSDGERTSEPVTVSLTVSPVNDAPIAEEQTVAVPVDERGAVVLTGSDVEGDALSFTLASQPGQGELLGTPPVLAYTPPEGFRGTTTFTFTVSDGVTTSAPATVTLVVGEEPPSPGGCGCAAGSSGGAFAAGLLLALLGLLRGRAHRCRQGSFL